MGYGILKEGGVPRTISRIGNIAAEEEIKLKAK